MVLPRACPVFSRGGGRMTIPGRVRCEFGNSSTNALTKGLARNEILGIQS